MSTIKKWQTMPTKNDETKLNDLAKKAWCIAVK